MGWLPSRMTWRRSRRYRSRVRRAVPTNTVVGDLSKEARSRPLSVDWALFAAVVCAAAVRLAGLFHHATIPDEAFTFFIASHKLPGIVALLRTGDFHPPLVYLIGHGLFALTSRAYLFRLVSAAFGVAGVVATYAIARRIVPRFALLAALLVALCPTLVFYDGFFRMYALLWSLCAISWALLLWALDDQAKWSRWLAYGASLCALLYTQYLAFFTVAAQIVYVFIFFRRAKGYWLALGLAALAFAPWLPILVEQYPLGGNAYRALQGHLSQLWLVPPLLLIDGLPSGIELNWAVVTALWLVIAGGLYIAIARKQWLVLAFVAPIALQLVYSLVSGKLLLSQRYLLQSIPALVILACIVFSWLWSTRLRLLAIAMSVVLCLLMLAGTIDKHFLPQYMPIDWTTYSRFLDSKLQPGDAVLYDGSMVYYVLVGSKATSGRPQFLVSNSKEAASFAAQAARAPRVWYIGYQTELPDPEHIAYATLARTHPQHISWRSTAAGYGDVVLTTLFLPAPAAKRGP